MILVSCAGFYQRACHFCEAASGTTASQALNVDAGSLEQQEQLLRQLLRFDESGGAAELRKALTLLLLGFFDDDACGMVFFWKFDRSIGHRTAAQIRVAQSVSNAGDQGAKLRIRIAWMGTPDFFVSGNGMGVQRPQVLRDQQILRFEMAVQRHLVGLCGSGDFIDAHGTDSTAIEEVTSRFKNAFARRRFGLPLRLRGLLQNFPLGSLTRYLPVSNVSIVTDQYHIGDEMSRVLFLEGKPEGFVMVKHALSTARAAVPEAKTSRPGGNTGAVIEGRFPGNRRFGRQAKKRAGQVNWSESAAFAV